MSDDGVRIQDGHGGDLAAATARFGAPKDGWLDLSTGINPEPYPFLTPSGESWTRLPQCAAEAALIAAAAKRYGVTDPACIAAAPGTQALLQWLPRLLPQGPVTVLAPAYGEYAQVWRAASADISAIADLTESARARIVVLANPNNPDGRRIAPERLLTLAGDLAARGGWLVADEAFADTEPEISLAPHTGAPGMIVLRSFGKFYGLAGLRLGFALAPADLAARLRTALGPWAVSGPAMEIGAQALNDASWAAHARDRLALAAAKLTGLLRQSGLEILGGTSLFVLARYPRAAALHDHLGTRGILVRVFADHPDRLRFGLPPARDFARLEAALAAWGAGR